MKAWMEAEDTLLSGRQQALKTDAMGFQALFVESKLMKFREAESRREVARAQDGKS